jgi:hypothetical protein
MRTAAAVFSGVGAFSARAEIVAIPISNESRRSKACHRAITAGNLFSFQRIAI